MMINSDAGSRASAGVQHSLQPAGPAVTWAPSRARGLARRQDRGAPGAWPTDRRGHRCGQDPIAAERLVAPGVATSGHVLVGHLMRQAIDTAGDRSRVQAVATGAWCWSGHRGVTSGDGGADRPPGAEGVSAQPTAGRGLVVGAWWLVPGGWCAVAGTFRSWGPSDSLLSAGPGGNDLPTPRRRLPERDSPALRWRGTTLP
jgi:hypothetical protein